jgi:hypothetical protein
MVQCGWAMLRIAVPVTSGLFINLYTAINLLPQTTASVDRASKHKIRKISVACITELYITSLKSKCVFLIIVVFHFLFYKGSKK